MLRQIRELLREEAPDGIFRLGVEFDGTADLNGPLVRFWVENTTSRPYELTLERAGRATWKTVTVPPGVTRDFTPESGKVTRAEHIARLSVKAL